MRPRRVGVTGHRQLPDDAGLEAAVDRVLDRCAAPAVVVSALAEGADRLVAARALARSGWELEALLPLPAPDYLADFATADSRAAFRDLLARARSTTVIAPQPSREEAYLVAGRAVVDTVDVVIALWDGEPPRGRGGTAEIVAYARATGRTVEWIRT